MPHVRTILLVGMLALALGCRNATAPIAPDATPADAGMLPGSAAVTPAALVGVGHQARGTVTLTVQQGVGRLDFSSDFLVSAVPGPFVYLNTTNNANTGQPLRIAALRSNTGAQSYGFVLPADVRYAYVLIWCDPYNVPVAQASIPSP